MHWCIERLQTNSRAEPGELLPSVSDEEADCGHYRTRSRDDERRCQRGDLSNSTASQSAKSSGADADDSGP